MSQLLTLRDTMVTRIKGLLPGFDVDSHLGRFDEEQLQAFLLSAPAVRVAVLGVADLRPTPDDGIDVVAQIGIYVVTKDKAVKLGRDEAAIAAVEGIVKLVDRNRWGMGGVCKEGGGARGAQNLYTAKVMKDGVALWAIDFRQPMRLTDVAAETGALAQLYVGIAPEIGPDHVADYILMEGPDV